MFNSPHLMSLWKAPLSGDVTQNIEPRLFSDDIAGDPDIEEHIHTDVASYGTQLARIMEALQILSEKAETPLPEITALQKRITAAKAETRERLASRATQALDRLRAASPEAYEALLSARHAERATDTDSRTDTGTNTGTMPEDQDSTG